MRTDGPGGVIHDAARGVFESATEHGAAYVTYAASMEAIDITYTFVPPAARDRGLGARLVIHARNWAREQGLAVTASCGFAADVLEAIP